MDKAESLALFARGRAAWNEWAAEKQAERDALKETGDWVESPDRAEQTSAWYESARADFSHHEFGDGTSFSGFIFPGDVRFRGAKFEGYAEFANAKFGGNAVFRGAEFGGNAGFGRAKFGGNAVFGGAKFGGDAWFGRAEFGGNAEFTGAKFGGNAVFRGVEFGGNAGFGRAKFGGDARFGGVEFGGDAGFGRAEFGGDARFGGAEFGGDARFGRAKFGGDARFGDAKFEGNAGFDQAVFGGRTTFREVKFFRTAVFRAIDGRTSFDLGKGEFRVLPDFIQAHFTEAPRLDNPSIEPGRFWWSILARVKALLKRDRDRTPPPGIAWSVRRGLKDYFKGDPDRTARWQALKRLAIQGHDHVSEQLFFSGELKSRRWGADMPWHARFWFGWVYQWLSDFGRSLVRPLIWWGFGIIGFAFLYLGQHPAFDGTRPAAQGPPLSSVGWVWHRAVDLVGAAGDAAAPPVSCVAADDDPMWAAFGLSLRNGLLFPAFASTAKQNQIYRCLYGVEGREGEDDRKLRARFLPKVPNGIAFLGLVQNLFSAVLIFLFLLAVRNHFRIK